MINFVLSSQLANRFPPLSPKADAFGDSIVMTGRMAKPAWEMNSANLYGRFFGCVPQAEGSLPISSSKVPPPTMS